MDAAIFQYGPLFRRAQLEGILSDCSMVYQKILSSGMTLNNRENEIRDRLADYLEDDSYKMSHTSIVRNFQVDHEIQEGAHGRIDFRFHQVNPYEGQRVYFIIECKRLDGSCHLNKEYVEQGINRFKTPGKYSSNLGVNGMMGFLVKPVDVNVTCRDINTLLAGNECLVPVSLASVNGCYEYESSHPVTSGTVMLLHLWMDFSSCVK